MQMRQIEGERVSHVHEKGSDKGRGRDKETVEEMVGGETSV